MKNQKVDIMAPHQITQRKAQRLAYFCVVAFLLVLLIILLRVQSSQGSLSASLLPFLSVPQETASKLNKFALIQEDLLIFLEILLLLSIFPIINVIFAGLHRSIDNWRFTRFRVIRIQKLELFIPNQLAGFLKLTAHYTRIAILGLVTVICLTLLFSMFQITEGLAQAVLVKLREVLSTFTDTVLTNLPNLIALLVIIVITRFALKLLRFIFDGLRNGKIKFPGFHHDLLEPTFQLLRFLVVGLALVAAFPYIPGSSSPVFRGISIFLGFLISLGSTSLVANIVSGIVITYTRGLQIDDRVQIGDTVGDVIERTTLVTRIRTIKNVVVSIPNAKVLQHEIINYSAEARERGLILNTSVTIGYDVPWRQVQQLMIAAAIETTYILQSPQPFVLKTNLDESYVNYELNAYTGTPALMADIYSELHQNILDKFNHAGVEIMSPSYLAIREGTSSTIPPKDNPKNVDTIPDNRTSLPRRTQKLSYHLHTRPR
ncbi:MAG: mechanosensitive ion channel family protein [Anaerolineales bacterium]|nr:mechanosensitive ion channel family protein [Anaerolineales bacterium]